MGVDEIPEWAKWITRDKNGSISVHEEYPEKNYGFGWWTNLGRERIITGSEETRKYDVSWSNPNPTALTDVEFMSLDRCVYNISSKKAWDTLMQHLESSDEDIRWYSGHSPTAIVYDGSQRAVILEDNRLTYSSCEKNPSIEVIWPDGISKVKRDNNGFLKGITRSGDEHYLFDDGEFEFVGEDVIEIL